MTWMKTGIAVLSLILAGGICSAGQAPAGSRSTLVHFGKVDEGVYKGSRPRTDADYRLLESHHVKYILDLQLIPSLKRSEDKKARRYGMEVIHARINASPVQPSEKHIASILAILRDRRFRPIYFHCALGRDRTALVAALYKMYFMGMSEPEAWRYMLEAGYQPAWVRDGLKKYLETHPTPPPHVALDYKKRS